MMPCVYDDVPGSWATQSEGWPSIHDPEEVARKLVIQNKLVPYGSYVTVDDRLRLETPEYVERVRAALEAATPNPVRAEQPEGKGAWTEDKLRATAKERGWHLRESASVPTEDGYRHPFEVCIPSRDLLRMLASAPAAPSAGVGVDALPFTDAAIDTMQAKMADYGFAVPVRVISEAFTAALAGKDGA